MIRRTFQHIDYQTKLEGGPILITITFLRSEFWRFIQLQTDDDKANTLPAQSRQQHAAHTCVAD